VFFSNFSVPSKRYFKLCGSRGCWLGRKKMATLSSKSLPKHDAVCGRYTAISDLHSHRKVTRVVCQQQSSSSVAASSSIRKSDAADENKASNHESAVVSMLLLTGSKIRASQLQWWSPLFDLPAAEDWSNVALQQKQTSLAGSKAEKAFKQELTTVSSSGQEEHRPGRTAQRFNRQQVQFTDEKARLLRKQTRATETWHDAWYHSGIASRLAEPDQ
jgi:hypothetical protein